MSDDAPALGAQYGSNKTAGRAYNSCINQYLVDLDVSGLGGKTVFVAGQWSASVPADPCDEAALMTVFVHDPTKSGSAQWRVLDQIKYTAKFDSTVGACLAEGYSNTAKQSEDGVTVTPSASLDRIRVAINAHHGDDKSDTVPVLVFGEVQ